MGFLLEESSRWGRFSGAGLGRILGTFTPKDTPEREKIGEGEGGKWEQKEGRSNELLQPSRVSLFVRHYARLKSDGIIVSHNNSLHLYYSILAPLRQVKSLIFGKNLTLEQQNHKCP